MVRVSTVAWKLGADSARSRIWTMRSKSCERARERVKIDSEAGDKGSSVSAAWWAARADRFMAKVQRGWRREGNAHCDAADVLGFRCAGTVGTRDLETAFSGGCGTKGKGLCGGTATPACWTTEPPEHPCGELCLAGSPFRVAWWAACDQRPMATAQGEGASKGTFYGQGAAAWPFFLAGSVGAGQVTPAGYLGPVWRCNETCVVKDVECSMGTAISGRDAEDRSPDWARANLASRPRNNSTTHGPRPSRDGAPDLALVNRSGDDPGDPDSPGCGWANDSCVHHHLGMTSTNDSADDDGWCCEKRGRTIGHGPPPSILSPPPNPPPPPS